MKPLTEELDVPPDAGSYTTGPLANLKPKSTAPAAPVEPKKKRRTFARTVLDELDKFRR